MVGVLSQQPLGTTATHKQGRSQKLILKCYHKSHHGKMEAYSSTSQLGIRPDPAKTEELEFPHSLVKNSQDEQLCNKADTKILT